MFAPHEMPHAEPASTSRHVVALPWTILVVDADADTRALYQQSFALVGCDVVDASDGREALTKALVRPPALVVTEILLPLLDGYALCDILRRDRTTAGVPILVVTAEARPLHIERARKAGADAVLVKPTTPEQVWAETQRLVGDAKQIRVHPAAAQPNAAAEGETSEPQRKRLSKAFARFKTTTPPSQPPALVCPSCDAPLTYEHSHVGGVSAQHPEQWDQYVCPSWCGTFQYRQRTRKLRRVE